MNKIYSLLFFLLCFHPAFSQVPMKRGSADRGGDAAAYEPRTAMKDVGARTGMSYYTQSGKYGFVQRDGKRLEAVYDRIEIVQSCAIVNRDGLWGLVDSSFNYIVKPAYTSIKSVYRIPLSNRLIVEKGGRFGLMDLSGQLLTDIAYEKMLYETHFQNFVVSNNGLKGTLTKSGHVILPTSYKEIFESDSASYSIARDREGLLRIIDQEGKILPVTFDKAIVYRNAIIVQSGEKYGAVWKDNKGHLKTVVPMGYDAVYPDKPIAKTNTPVVDQKRDMASTLVLLKDRKYGLVDNQGNMIYPVEYDNISAHNGFYRVQKDKLYRAYFVKGKHKLDMTYQTIDDFGTGTYRVTVDRKQGLISDSGKLIVPAVYDQIVQRIHMYKYKTALLKVKMGDKFGLITEANRSILPVAYDFIQGWRDTLLLVGTENPRKVGVIDRNGSFVIPADYIWISEGLTARSNLVVLAHSADSYNFMDQHYQLLLTEPVKRYSPIYDSFHLLEPRSFNGIKLMAVQGKDGKYGILNEGNGRLVLPMIYDSIAQRLERPDHTYLSVVKDKKFGIVNDRNEVIVPFDYTYLGLDMQWHIVRPSQDIDVALIIARKGKKYGLINAKNQTVIPFKYDDLGAISYDGLYKVKAGKYYHIVNSKNEIVHAGPFDDVAAFEFIPRFQELQALTFHNGMMRVINQKGEFVSAAQPMAIHRGYRSYGEMKSAFIQAMEGSDAQLTDYANKTVPSAHLFYFIKGSILDRDGAMDRDLDQMRYSYTEALRNAKSSYYNAEAGSWIRSIKDYTTQTEEGLVTNSESFYSGVPSSLEVFLKNAVKINGYWISTWFMNP